MNRRRTFLRLAGAGLALAGGGALCGCARSGWPEGMAEIKWDRDTCARCKMVISDRRFAAEARGGPRDEVVKFDDIGCAAFWLREQTWGQDPATRIWVAASSSPPTTVTWLDARQAYYVGNKTSPMGYNFAATAAAGDAAIDFAAMRALVLARGR